MSKLRIEQVQLELSKLEGWTLSAAGEITRTFKRAGFLQALAFVNAVGLFAEAAQHHPVITINWNKVTLTLTTHDDGGLSEKDFNLAQQINDLPAT